MAQYHPQLKIIIVKTIDYVFPVTKKNDTDYSKDGQIINSINSEFIART